MKKKQKQIQTLQQQIEKVIKENQKNKSITFVTQQEDLQYVDFNKSIETMLTAKPEDNKPVENILSL